ncbi:MAG: CBS domain-containing protein [Gammaproteobacteria bacterium]|nr:CBS domain-containing protein [Gammaproteobacteria bacterium]
MTMDVLTTSPSAPLKEAARTMVREGVSGLPVIDESGELVGIITEADFLEREADRSRRRLLNAMFRESEALVDADTVGEVMTKDPVVIFPEASVAEAARVMAHNHVKRLPVVGAQGKLVGIISRADVVAVFTRPDDVIEDEIREDIVRRVLLLEGDSVDVTVKDGVVTISGTVPTTTDARLLEELIRRVDGVVKLRSHVTFDVDDA